MITKKLLALNGISIIMVVLYHAAGWTFVAMFWWTDRYRAVSVPNFDLLGSPPYFLLRFIEQLVIFAIPAFLFVSGYFIAFATGKNQLAPKWKNIFSRIKSLGIPFLIWSVIMLVFKIQEGASLNLLDVLEMILLGKTTEAFYFIPLLIQLYLLSPLITRAAKRSPVLLLLITGFFLILVRFGQYMVVLNWDIPGREIIRFFMPSWFFPGNIFWFAFGVVVAFNLNRFLEWFTTYRMIFLIGAILLIPAGMAEWEYLLSHSGREWFPPRETILDSLYGFFVLISFFTFGLKKLINIKWVNQLGSLSFGIYLAHTAVMTVSAKLVYHLLPDLLGYPYLYLPLLIVFGLFGPIILINLTKRSPLKRWYGYLFG